MSARRKMTVVEVLLLVTLLTSCARFTSRTVSTPAPPRVPNIYHVVQAGQTLSDVASLYEVPLAQLRRANQLGPGASPRVGQRLLIPGEGRLAILPLPPESPPQKSAPSVRKSSRPAPQMEGEPRREERQAAVPDLGGVSFTWPLRGEIVGRFGETEHGRNDGIDIAAPADSDIRAASSGQVIFSDWGPQDFGRIVVIKHSEKIITVYAHTAVNYVKKGDAVRQGQPIARIGAAGNPQRPILHFEVRYERRPRDPLQILPR
ncbi:MAG: M23 family metallopeptidase [Candidatus Tectomicrobia bacterium]|nr:M23 family metallopeptidase [Candidatus Tectomicrobia bacterium]